MRHLLFAFLWVLLFTGIAFGQNNSALTPQALPGLNLLVRGGNILLGGSSIGISNTTVTLGNNTTTYVFLSTGGAIQTNTTGYAVSVLPIATVVTSQGQIIDIQDNRPDYIFGGGSSGSATVTVTSSATPTFTVTTSPAAFTVTDFFMLLTANVTSSSIAGTFKQGDEVVITLQQNGTGGWSFTWPSGFLNTPTVQSTAGSVTAMTFQYCGTVGNGACPANSWQATDVGASGTYNPALFAVTYGVKADEVRNFDGVLTNTPPTGTGNSTTATSPAITTTVANDAVINIFETVSGNFSVNPATGTNIVSVNQAAGQYGAFVNWQTVASPSTVPAVTGTFAANQTWMAGTIALKPSGTIAARTATNHQQSTGATLTLTVPTGTANGDFLVVCIEYFVTNVEVSNSVLPPTAFTYRLLATRDATPANGVAADRLSCFGRVAASEPATYVFTQNVTNGGMTGWMEAFTNVLGVDSAPTLTSASASFTSADVNKDICIAGILQSCGTVSSVTSGTVLVCNTCYSATGSSNEYRYGTDNTTALQTAINAVGTAGGGTLALPNGGMMVNAQLTLPTTASIIVRGVASAVANWGFQGGLGPGYQAGTVVNNSKIGTEIDWATTTSSGACLLYNPGNNGIINNVYQETLQDLTLWGGAGTSQDGCGSHGFEAINASWLALRNVKLGNFIGNGFLATNAGTTGYTDGITLDNFWSMLNGLSGAYINNGTIAAVQNILIQNSQFDNNSLFGLELGGLITGFKLQASNLQRNGGVATSGVGINLFFDNGGTIQGCSIDSNFFEHDNTGGAGVFYNLATTAQLFCQWTPQVASSNETDSNKPGPIASGFDAAAAITQKNDTLPATSFQVDVGTPASVAAGSVTLPPAPNVWSCTAQNLTAHLGNRADDTVVTASTKTSVSVQNQTKSTGAAANWVAHDAVQVNCTAF